MPGIGVGIGIPFRKHEDESSYWTTHMPTALTVEWVDDYANVSFTDNSDGEAQHEIWQSLNGGAFTLQTTLNAGVTTFEDHTWQKAMLTYRVRAKQVGSYSPYTDDVNVTSLWTLKVTLTEAATISIQDIHLYHLNKLVVINWGDTSTTNVTATSTNPVSHDYSGAGTYWIHLTGDIESINFFEFFSRSYLAGTDIGHWILPTYFQFGHFHDNGFVGDITDIIYPSLALGCNFGGNAHTADITNWVFPSLYWDMHIQSTVTNGITGDINNWVLPERIAHFNINGYVTGDLTTIIPYVNTTYGGILLNLVSTHPIGFTGDLSGWTLPDKPGTLIAGSGCHFTKLPRGHYSKISQCSFQNNSCDSDEINNFLAFLNDYFASTAPTTDCTYTLYGASMGSPSPAGLAAKEEIQAKFTAAGYTATILLNAAVGYIQEYEDMLGVFNTEPTGIEANIENTLVETLVNDSVWAKIKGAYIFAGHSDDDSLWNWKTPAGDTNATKQGTPAWAKYEGYTGDGGTNYLKSNFNPTVDGDGIAQNDVCVLWGIGSDGFENKYDINGGAGATPSLSAMSRAAVSTGYFRPYCNDQTIQAIVNTNAIKHYALSRIVAGNYDAYINAAKTNLAISSTGLPNIDITLILGVKQMRYFIISTYLTEAEVTIVRNAMEAYLDSYGKGLM